MLMKNFGAILSAGLAVMVFGLGLVGCDKPTSEVNAGKPVTPAPVATAAITTNAPADKPAFDLQKLKGRWLRPDGGYVIEIRQVDASGQLEAGYFNPKPIRVVSSVARVEGAAAKVFLELNDVNYPGCKYDLTYIPDRDWLVGTYFQAALQQTFEVVFERTK